MRRVCRVLLIGFLGVYAAALVLLVYGGGGVSGPASDPVAGLLLRTLGLPWSLLRDAVPSTLSPLLVTAGPVANLLILRSICNSLRD